MWFLRGETGDKCFQYRKSQSSLFILGNRKWISFILKTIMAKYRWKWSLPFFNGVATVDVIVASKLILPKLNPHILRDSIGVLFWENKQSGPRFLAMANFIVCLPPEVPLDIRFYPINPKVRAKMVGIVNKVYRINFLLCQIGRCINVFPEDAPPCGLMLIYWRLSLTASLPGRVQSVPNFFLQVDNLHLE